MHQGGVNSRNMTLTFTPHGGATKWVAAPFNRSGAIEFTSIGALRWVNTKDHGRDNERNLQKTGICQELKESCGAERYVSVSDEAQAS